MGDSKIGASMNQLVIRGGRPLHGQVEIGGAKNAATKMMIASLLTDQPVTLKNCPRIGDVEITAEICRALGAKVYFDGSTVRLHTPKITATKVRRTTARNRISVLALSPLLQRAGQADLPLVGGDQIGPRPVNYHLQALRQMGAQIEETSGGYKAKASELHGATVELPYPSVGATENIILAAVLARGRTHIHNAAIEPEVVDLIKMLQQMGAIIEFRANRVIIVDGVERLSGVEYSIMPDRLEVASYALMAIATDGEILVKNARQDDLITFLNTIRRIGATYTIEADGICFRRSNQPLIGIEVETETHPGFATDWQQPLVVLLTQAKGLSVVHETVYEDRFGYTETLVKMGARINIFSKCLGEIPCRFKGQMQKHSAVINGPTPLVGTDVEVPDIRAGMAHVIAAMVAEGESRLTGIEHLLRGYQNLLSKLESIGADFTAQE
jgi:UDP-N-acetylglucosamine 1-carboxyvinyltransferase